MRISPELEQAIEELAQPHRLKSLIQGRESVSEDYRKGVDSSRSFQDEERFLSYLITRFPATFAACCKVFEELTLRLPECSIHSLLDLGSGPGSASWAAAQTFPELREIQMMEREARAIRIGKQLATNGNGVLQRAVWTEGALDREFALPKVDLVVLSYVLAELSPDQSSKLLDQLLLSSIPLIALIEPGTPRGYRTILELRDQAIQKGARIVAPCPHQLKCPMSGEQWCHFPARVERTALHRRLKGGTLGFEDEKFSYVVIAKSDVVVHELEGRVINRPLKGSGFVKLPLCSSEGVLKELSITRKNKKDYKAARDMEWGSSWMDGKFV